jgi:hypothetical protein
MTAEEKRAMKAACVQVAATLIAARDAGKGEIDIDECVRLAAIIYVRVATTDWREPERDADDVASFAFRASCF